MVVTKPSMTVVQDDQEQTDRESSSEMESEQEEAEVSETGEEDKERKKEQTGSNSRLGPKRKNLATVTEKDVLKILKNRQEALSLKDIKKILLQDNSSLEKLPSSSVNAKIKIALDKVIQKGKAVKERRGMNFKLLNSEEEEAVVGSRRERRSRSSTRCRRRSRSRSRGRKCRRRSRSKRKRRRTKSRRRRRRSRRRRRRGRKTKK